MPERIPYHVLRALRAMEPERIYKFPEEPARAATVNRLISNGLAAGQGQGFGVSLPGLLLWLEPGKTYPWPVPGTSHHRGAVSLLGMGLICKASDTYTLTEKGKQVQGRVRIDGAPAETAQLPLGG